MAKRQYRGMLYEVTKRDDGLFFCSIYTYHDSEPSELSMDFDTPEEAERDAEWIIDDIVEYVDEGDYW